MTDDGIGTNQFAVSGADAASFEVDSTGLYLKAGTTVDFETKNGYSVVVEVDDIGVGATPDATVPYHLTVLDLIDETQTAAKLIISEVAPWGSGNSPYAVDWIEITNTGTTGLSDIDWSIDPVDCAGTVESLGAGESTPVGCSYGTESDDVGTLGASASVSTIWRNSSTS